ncbi:hypothetical protein GZH47_18485 [Paenibacillus rhizovicinus]|uniref:DegT/DnrJ/EryC1/StrS aminotransferase family protein n=1 Tax=Paenibacillus rhizovicinus TaxID=2704463 RepID=A0A6C0P2A9_9BACL|nr:DegT/DnrJ/EryC1/StrS family aminotransferase [Paenibacillus rhizovicinus]QHW32607.1 hypothetical protein GZH47_18485 [Paenibacillus rhizovicinus]
MTHQRIEIGSEFSLDAQHSIPKDDTFLHRLEDFQTMYYRSGRSAIRGVVSQINGRRALIPAYICQSVIEAFEQENYILDFYTINKDFSIDIDDVSRKLTEATDVFFLMHYFGKLQSDDDLQTIHNLCRSCAATIVEDTTHSILTKPRTVGDYCVASLRKWFALPDGGVAYRVSGELNAAPNCVNRSFTNARAAGMFLKGLYLEGLTGGHEVYRDLFAKAEKWMDGDNEAGEMSELSKQFIAGFDVGDAVSKRGENANYLADHINNRFVSPALGTYRAEESPFFYTLYVEKRDGFRSYLNRHHIYCPVHWPIEDQRLFEFATVKYISEHLISIPIDQRYDLVAMEYISRIINQYEEDSTEGLR